MKNLLTLLALLILISCSKDEDEIYLDGIWYYYRSYTSKNQLWELNECKKRNTLYINSLSSKLEKTDYTTTNDGCDKKILIYDYDLTGKKIVENNDGISIISYSENILILSGFANGYDHYTRSKAY